MQWVIPWDVWYVIVIHLKSPLDLVSVSSTCRALWNRFHTHPLIMEWRPRDIRYGLLEASKLGLQDLAVVYIRKGANNLILACGAAIFGNQLEMVDLLLKCISPAQSTLDYLLYNASLRGRKQIVDFLIVKGACDWHLALTGAHFGRNDDMIHFFEEKINSL